MYLETIKSEAKLARAQGNMHLTTVGNSRIQKLLSLNELLDKNKNIDVALDSIKPRIFWKDKPILKTQLKIWNIEKLERAKKIILESEIVIKTKMNSLSDILIKKLLIEIYMIGNSTS